MAPKGIKKLYSFKVSMIALTEVAKFEELYQIWRKVVNDLKNIDLRNSLKNVHTLKIFQSKMQSSSLETYVNLKWDSAIGYQKFHEVMDVFMDRERQPLRQIKQYETLSSKVKDKKGNCNNCSKPVY